MCFWNNLAVSSRDRNDVDADECAQATLDLLYEFDAMPEQASRLRLMPLCYLAHMQSNILVKMPSATSSGMPPYMSLCFFFIDVVRPSMQTAARTTNVEDRSIIVAADDTEVSQQAA